MKTSQFNSNFFLENHHIWYNAFSNEFLILEPFIHELLVASINDNNVNEIKDIHNDFYYALTEKGFIVEDETDEIKLVKQKNYNLINDDTMYHITINPTMNCNFKCWYCYESHIKDSKLSEKIIDSIKKHIVHVRDTNHNLKQFKLSWFGGEPLLYYKTTVKPILEFANLLFNNKINFYSTFTTNGLLIDQEMIEDFKINKVTFLQITLDGYEEQHNKVRYISKNKGSYKKIVQNIVLLAENEINVTIRINYSKETLEKIELVADYFTDLDKKILKYIAFDFHQVWQEEDDLTSLLDAKLIYFKNKGLISTQRDDIDNFKSPCYADKKNHATINYNGEVFKCTARDFNSSSKEGDLLENGIIKWNEKYSTRLDAKIKNTPCFSCSILPVCGGGCSQISIENSDVDYCVKDFDENKKLNVVKNKFMFFLENATT